MIDRHDLNPSREYECQAKRLRGNLRNTDKGRNVMADIARAERAKKRSK